MSSHYDKLRKIAYPDMGTDPDRYSPEAIRLYRDQLDRRMSAVGTVANSNTIVGLLDRISIRLFDGNRRPLPFEFCDAYNNNEKVFVFIVNNGEPVVLTDDKHLYPSDALVTQVRLLMETKRSNNSSNNSSSVKFEGF